MYNSKLFRCLQALNKKEWKDLAAFVKFYHEDNSEISRLFHFIYPHHSNLEHQQFSLDYVNREIFQGKTRKHVLNTMSQLCQVVLKFLVINELEDNEGLQDMLQYEVLLKKKLFKDAERIAKKSSVKAASSSELDIWQSFFSFRIQFFRHFSDYPKFRGHVKRKVIFDGLIQLFQLFASQMSLFLSAELHNYQRLIPEGNHAEPYILDKYHLEQEDELNMILQDLLKLVSSPTYEHHADDSFTTLVKHNRSMTEFLRASLYYRLRAYYLFHARRGHKKYNRQFADLILWSTGQDTMIDLSSTVILSDISILCYLDVVEVAEDYLNVHNNKVKNEMMRELFKVCRMMIDFSQKQYEEVLFNFQRMLFKIPIHKLHAYNIMMKAAFEFEQDDEDLRRYSKNFEAFIFRNKKELAKSLPIFFGNFNKGFRYLIKNKDKLKIFLQQEVPIKDRKWLTEKVRE